MLGSEVSHSTVLALHDWCSRGFTAIASTKPRKAWPNAYPRQRRPRLPVRFKGVPHQSVQRCREAACAEGRGT
jgi:hypothetical protein